MKHTLISFAEAMAVLKAAGGLKHVGITRKFWYGSKALPIVKMQVPDENSFMTEPYLYMEKFKENGKLIRFPVDLSAESVMADDWVIIDQHQKQPQI